MFDLERVLDAVALGRIDHQFKLFVGLLEFIDELRRVLHMDVVVHHSVNEQQFAGEVFCRLGDRRTVVTGGIILRREHISLGIDRIVQTIVRDRTSGYADLE